MTGEWTKEDRERIDLYKLGHSVKLIAIMRDEPEEEVRRSVQMLLDILDETGDEY
jgi:hypothetical protein